MQLIREELYPGITLNVLPDSRFKTNYISLAFLCDMTSENAALSHLLPMVLGRGSAKYPDLGAINRALEMIWDGTLDSGTGRMGETRTIGFSACYPDNRFLPTDDDIEEKTLDIFFDILLNPKTENGAFTKEYVESEKEKLCQRIAAAKNSKGKYAFTRARQELCKNEPYGIASAGTREEVMAITPEGLFDFYQTVRNDLPLEIFYIGRSDPMTLAKKLRSRLSSLALPKKSVTGSLVIRAAKEARYVEEISPSKQGHLCLGFRTGSVLSDKDFPAFNLMNEILGGSPVSLLFTNVREKESLCYYCSSVPDSLKGVLMISAGIRDDNRERAEKSILKQVEAMQKGRFTDAEMAAALHCMESALLGIGDSRSTLESFTLRRLLANVDTSCEHYLTVLRSVTRDDIIAAANRLCLDTVYYLKPDITQGGEEDAEDEY